MPRRPIPRWPAALALLLIVALAALGAGAGGPTRAAGPTATATATAEGPRLFLPLVLMERCLTEEREPNDTGHQAAQSYNALCLDVPMSGALASPADYRDVYLLDLAAPGALRLRLDDMPPTVDYDLALFDSANRPLAYATTRGSGPEEILVEEPLAPGRYLVMVYSYQGFSPQHYRLSATVP